MQVQKPTLVVEYDVHIKSALTVHVLLKKYDGHLCNSALRLLVDEWERAEQAKLIDIISGRGYSVRIKIFSGFDDLFAVHKFAYGGETPEFRQTTIVELLALGADVPSLGLDNFVYALGSAHIDPAQRIACGMVDPMIFYPGLESMDGMRQMVTRAIDGQDDQIALVKL